MGVFRFKRFSVVNEKSAMKVNTDGVLLGASMTIKPSDRKFLDVGTGTGTIALMAAQRICDIAPQHSSEILVEAVEIDPVSAEEADNNFKFSPWSDIIRVHNVSFAEFSSSDTEKYDLIFSNPPYFESSLLAPSRRRCDARHTSSGLSYRELLDFASSRLGPQGRFSVVLPAEQEDALCRYARMCGLYLFRIVRIRTVPRKAPGRIVAEFSAIRCESPEQELVTIQNEGKYTQEYLSLTQDFYLFA